ncbi:membrane protein [Arthrobacter phage Aoka]|nr:membrane protein [Arthrobacter phage Aoka]
MSPAKHRAEVFIQPKNRRPLKKTTIVDYTTPADFRKKLERYAATVWITAKAIFVDTSSKEIIVDGTAVANYAVHIAGEPAPETPAVPTVPVRRTARAATRHTLAQLTVTTLGLTLILTAAGTINALYLAGFALAGFGLYRLGLGVDRREAIQ